jgi:hypothetical protein
VGVKAVVRSVFWFCCALLLACGSGKELEKIEQLVAAGKALEAKKLYEEYLNNNTNPNIERAYIRFLFDNKMYVDFNAVGKAFLARFPQDTDTKNLFFEYYGKLARDAERQGQYETASRLITAHLLSPDYSEWRKWESRQTTILKKWYEETAVGGQEADMRKVLVQIRALGFENLASSLAPELNARIDAEAEARKEEAKTEAEAEAAASSEKEGTNQAPQP